MFGWRTRPSSNILSNVNINIAEEEPGKEQRLLVTREDAQTRMREYLLQIDEEKTDTRKNPYKVGEYVWEYVGDKDGHFFSLHRRLYGDNGDAPLIPYLDRLGEICKLAPAGLYHPMYEEIQRTLRYSTQCSYYCQRPLEFRQTLSQLGFTACCLREAEKRSQKNTIGQQIHLGPMRFPHHRHMVENPCQGIAS